MKVGESYESAHFQGFTFTFRVQSHDPFAEVQDPHHEGGFPFPGGSDDGQMSAGLPRFRQPGEEDTPFNTNNAELIRLGL